MGVQCTSNHLYSYQVQHYLLHYVTDNWPDATLRIVYDICNMSCSNSSTSVVNSFGATSFTVEFAPHNITSLFSVRQHLTGPFSYSTCISSYAAVATLVAISLFSSFNAASKADMGKLLLASIFDKCHDGSWDSRNAASKSGFGVRHRRDGIGAQAVRAIHVFHHRTVVKRHFVIFITS